ncbi:nitronate monooxygenase [Belnapia sp. T6]|uniref:Nitronate monooxygenase n=1 Tax=Belnapia mucosa TaxID=2804532 RepID=A0ABS1VAS1_9PROT|nr:nitronate monooxygenase [Belnapia mucosa]
MAQGTGAGGHVRGTVGTFPLLGDVLDAVSMPVRSAGGIGTAKAVAAALATGADSVRVGTRFVATYEAGAHPEYMATLIAARAEDTVYTGAFHLGWPDVPLRVLRSCITAAEAFQGDQVDEAVRLDGTRMPILRFGTAVVDRTVTGLLRQWRSGPESRSAG